MLRFQGSSLIYFLPYLLPTRRFGFFYRLASVAFFYVFYSRLVVLDCGRCFCFVILDRDGCFGLILLHAFALLAVYQGFRLFSFFTISDFLTTQAGFSFLS